LGINQLGKRAYSQEGNWLGLYWAFFVTLRKEGRNFPFPGWGPWGHLGLRSQTKGFPKPKGFFGTKGSLFGGGFGPEI